MSREITGIDKFVFSNDNYSSTVSTQERVVLNNIFETEENETKTTPIVRTVNDYYEAKEIIEEVKKGNSILLQLDHLASTEEGKIIIRRILDYIGGAMYVMDKKIEKVASLSFLLNA